MEYALGPILLIVAIIHVVDGLYEASQNSRTDWSKREWPHVQYQLAIERLEAMKESHA